MEKGQCYERYPSWMIAVSLLFWASTYALGIYILSGFGIVAVGAYLAYCLFTELRVLNTSCRNCYYFGKACCLGRGKFASLIFKKGTKGFSDRKVSWTDVLPDMLVAFIPVVAGAVLLILGFRWPVLGAMVGLVLLATAGTGFVRGSLACKHCKQRELGCPAMKLFEDRASRR